MKTTLLVGALAAVLVLPAAYAAEPNAPTLVAYSTANQSALSRAQVKQETRAAELSNQIPRGQQSWPDASLYTPSHTARAEVKAETRVAEARGLIPRGESELHNAAYVTPASVLPRAEVKAETRAAVSAHQIPRGESNIDY
jgi:hypothetical protein